MVNSILVNSNVENNSKGTFTLIKKGKDYLMGLTIGKIAKLKTRHLMLGYPGCDFVIQDSDFNKSIKGNGRGRVGVSEDAEFIPVFGYADYLYCPVNNGFFVSVKKKKVLNYVTKDSQSDRRKVSLYKNGKHSCEYIHKLAWTSVNGPLQDGYEVHHKNGICSDNQICNLAAVTKEDHKKITRDQAAINKGIPLYKAPTLACAEVDPQGKIIRKFDSIHIAARKAGRPVKELRKHLEGRAPTFAGGRWVYLDYDGYIILPPAKDGISYIDLILGAAKLRSA